MKRRVFLTVALMCVAGAAWMLSQRTTTVAAPMPRTVVTAVAAERPLGHVWQFSGFVRGVRTANLASTTGGRVVRMVRTEGDRVRRGEVIAVLDGKSATAQLAAATASRDAVTRVAAAQDRAGAQGVLQARTTAADIADDRRNDSAETEGKDVAAARQAVTAARREREVRFLAADAARVAADGAVAVARVAAGEAIIRAPWDGVIVARFADEGSVVGAGAGIVTLADTAALEAVGMVAGDVAQRVHVGDVITVTPEDATAPVEGRVVSVALDNDPDTHDAAIRIRFGADAAAALWLGAHVAGAQYAVAQDAPLVTSVPRSAVVRTYDDTAVAVIRDGVVTRMPVRILAATDDDILVDGIAPGTTVILDAAALVPGENVTAA